MREILFRGKHINNGNWIYGHFVHQYGADMIYLPEGVDSEFGFDYHYIAEGTLGQYTGLTDKNGKKIFEGDILKIARVSNSMGSYYFPPLVYPVNVVVRWDMCAWTWETLCKDKRYIHFPDAWCHYDCEVIGNIHDNPELLKGE